MAFTNVELEDINNKLNAYIERIRPPEDVRDEVDIAFKIEKQSVIIFEKRKMFDSDKLVEIPMAKTTYVIKDKKWKVYWLRADLKWHAYQPKSEVKTIMEFIKVVDKDQHGCFWG